MTYPTGASIYPKGFITGLILRNQPLNQTQPGRVFWVSNSTTLAPGELAGSNGNDGSFYKPFSTIAYGISQCTASHGDIVMVKPGHAESIANATTLAFSKAGVAVVGLGWGSNRPTLTFTTAIGANIPITAANCSISNFLFKANFADITSVFTATGTATPTDFNVENCEFRDGTSVLNFLAVVTGNATANSLDGFRFVGNKISSLCTTAGRGSISFLSATDRIEISDNSAAYAVLNDTACFIQASTFQLTNFYLGRNVATVPNTSSTGGSFVSGSGNAWTGVAFDNYFTQADASAGIWIATGHGTAFGFANNKSNITFAANTSAIVNPAEA